LRPAGGSGREGKDKNEQSNVHGSQGSMKKEGYFKPMNADSSALAPLVPK
jgi:hypothetical protein